MTKGFLLNNFQCLNLIFKTKYCHFDVGRNLREKLRKVKLLAMIFANLCRAACEDFSLRRNDKDRRLTLSNF